MKRKHIVLHTLYYILNHILYALPLTMDCLLTTAHTSSRCYILPWLINILLAPQINMKNENENWQDLTMLQVLRTEVKWRTDRGREHLKQLFYRLSRVNINSIVFFHHHCTDRNTGPGKVDQVYVDSFTLTAFNILPTARVGRIAVETLTERYLLFPRYQFNRNQITSNFKIHRIL